MSVGQTTCPACSVRNGPEVVACRCRVHRQKALTSSRGTLIAQVGDFTSTRFQYLPRGRLRLGDKLQLLNDD